MKVLLTGAAGFIGSRVRRALGAAGHEVVGVDLMLESAHGPDAPPPDGVVRVDLRDGEALAPLLAGVDTVCHLAARVGDESGCGDGDFVLHNDHATTVLLAAMSAAGVRSLVLASSVVVYGEGRYRTVRGGPFFPGLRARKDLDRGMFDHRAPRSGEVLTWEPVAEDTPPRPRSAYAASKAAQEHYAYAWGLNAGAAVTVLRYHSVYGEGARVGPAARFRDDLFAGRAPRVFEDGGQVRDLVHVDDVAAATVAAVERQPPGFVPLNIGSGHPITLWEVASLMAKATGGPTPVVTGQYRIGDVRHFVGDHRRAAHTIGFTARIAPARGLAEFARGAVGNS